MLTDPENMIVVIDRSCTDIYDYSISDKADIVLMEDMDDSSVEHKYVKAVDLKADVYIDSNLETVEYFIENGIAAICLK